jgi:2-oxoisovalerate dehydrogenase E2 component (dihydrolipoyl transacylase)
MVRSVQTAPHAWLMVEVDVTPLVRLRAAMREEFRRREGCDLSYVAFVLKAVVEGLREYPVLNSTWGEDRIVLKRTIDVGIAVGLDDGIIVPVIRRADEKSLTGLAREVADLTSRARAGRLSVGEVQGGTFTLNNTGAFGSIASQPIINQPQAAILNMEAIVKRPVVVTDPTGAGDDSIAIRSMMNLSMSFDHRILDGYTAGKFLQGVKRRLEGYGPGSSLY